MGNRHLSLHQGKGCRWTASCQKKFYVPHQPFFYKSEIVSEGKKKVKRKRRENFLKEKNKQAKQTIKKHKRNKKRNRKFDSPVIKQRLGTPTKGLLKKGRVPSKTIMSQKTKTWDPLVPPGRAQS